jgi:hypothetical protein
LEVGRGRVNQIKILAGEMVSGREIINKEKREEIKMEMVRKLEKKNLFVYGGQSPIKKSTMKTSPCP